MAIWCEIYQDYYGNFDPKYGGVLTDLRTLLPGTKFFVANGWWTGEVLADNYILIHRPDKDVIMKLTEENCALYLDNNFKG